MSTVISRRICGHCHEFKPWEEFEQPMLVLQDYRVPWFKDRLLSIKEFYHYQLEKKKKKRAWHQNELKTAKHILKTIDARYTYSGPNPCVEIPVNDYERDWLKGQFTHHRNSKLSYLEQQFKNERKNQISLVELEGDLYMINHILRIIDMSYMDQCKACADTRRRPQFVLDSWMKDHVIVHKVPHVPSWEATEKRGPSSMRRIR